MTHKNTISDSILFA